MKVYSNNKNNKKNNKKISQFSRLLCTVDEEIFLSIMIFRSYLITEWRITK